MLLTDRIFVCTQLLAIVLLTDRITVFIWKVKIVYFKAKRDFRQTNKLTVTFLISMKVASHQGYIK